ncbi:MAG: SIS domain-containing protein, partial [Rhabdochlamydiaceae bacterium]
SAASRSLSDLYSLPAYVSEALTLQNKIKEISDKYISANDFYIVGRGDNFPIALEGALKLKELSYVHAEGMAAGELKHGTIALIEDGTPVILLNPPDETYVHSLTSATELRSRGARIIGISTVNHPSYDDFIKLPCLSSKLLYPILEMIPLQMLAYFTAVGHNLDPDYPRNLAKSVTVV